jgi:hypothetical protein
MLYKRTVKPPQTDDFMERFQQQHYVADPIRVWQRQTK